MEVNRCAYVLNMSHESDETAALIQMHEPLLLKCTRFTISVDVVNALN